MPIPIWVDETRRKDQILYGQSLSFSGERKGYKAKVRPKISNRSSDRKRNVYVLTAYCLITLALTVGVGMSLTFQTSEAICHQSQPYRQSRRSDTAARPAPPPRTKSRPAGTPSPPPRPPESVPTHPPWRGHPNPLATLTDHRYPQHALLRSSHCFFASAWPKPKPALPTRVENFSYALDTRPTHR